MGCKNTAKGILENAGRGLIVVLKANINQKGDRFLKKRRLPLTAQNNIIPLCSLLLVS